MHPINYETIDLRVSDLDRIQLPKFQRGYVWNASKQRDFIETLHHGFPFGALLVYPESSSPDSNLILLDGQQRLSTIKEYQNKPLQFWKPINKAIYNRALAKINEHLIDSLKIDENKFDYLINSAIDGQQETVNEWADDVDDKEDRGTVRKAITDICQEIRDYIDLQSIKIWAIKFIGDRSDLPTVFANLNKGGVPLTKYQVFDAAWSNIDISLSDSDLQDKLLDNIISYYKEKEDESEFDLTGFDEVDLREERKISLSELGIALGMFVTQNLKSLISQSKKATLEIGFGILGVATGTDNRKLNELVNKADIIRTNLEEILEKTSQICISLEGMFSKLLHRINSNKNDKYEKGLSSTFKTLSYFAALWSLNSQSKQYIETIKHIKAYYVFDSLTQVWSSHGDQRLYEYYPQYLSRDYLTPLTKETMWEAFRQWLEDETPGINFSGDVTALTTIHANLTYLSAEIPHGEDYELEHIIPRKLIKSADNTTQRKILGRSLGNCMYLPRSINNSKKTKTLYDINKEGSYDKLMRSSLYPEQAQLENVIKALKVGEYNGANYVIQQRANQVAHSLSDLLTSDN